MKRIVFITLLLALVCGAHTPARAMFAHGNDDFPAWTGWGNAGHGPHAFAGERPESQHSWAAPEREDDWNPWGFEAPAGFRFARGAAGGWGSAGEPARFGLGQWRLIDDDRAPGHRELNNAFFPGSRPPQGRAEDWLMRMLAFDFLANLHYQNRHDRDPRPDWHDRDHRHWPRRRHHHDHSDPLPTPIPGAALLFAPGLAAIALIRKKRAS